MNYIECKCGGEASSYVGRDKTTTVKCHSCGRIVRYRMVDGEVVAEVVR